MTEPKIRPLYTLQVPYCTKTCPSYVQEGKFPGCCHLPEIDRQREVCTPEIQRVVAAFETLTGEHPKDAPSLGALIKQHIPRVQQLATDLRGPQMPPSKAHDILIASIERYKEAFGMSAEAAMPMRGAVLAVAQLLGALGILKEG